MNPQRAQDLIQNFVGKRLLVLGDLMLDEFIWGEVRRISPEAPVPVVEVKRESLHAGGAGNAVSNLLALGARAIPVGIIGDDRAGEQLRERFAEAGAETGLLIVDKTRPTTMKTRIVAHHQQMIRADRESRAPIPEAIEDQLIATFTAALQDVDAVIVSDYDKGTLTPRVLQTVLAAAAHKTVCLDPKLKNFAAYRPVTVIKPNQMEAERATGIEIHDDASLLAAAQQIRTLLECPYVLITRGEHGMSLVSQEAVTHIPPLAREVYDVTGAGDTVIATLTLALAAGADIVEAATIANHAAGIVVGKVGTATVSRDDLIQAMSFPSLK
ncbi:MAG TPA: D-glycero-beta-D-manno-heptose-7-phosphate kinase [Blastocatellia bacterium]|nr:D-glycero-beta-D-manno-heptose-7-phosphate kinase [Blastocatellia bacterium]